MPQIVFKVQLHFLSDYHLGSGFGHAGVVDDTVVKDGNGQLYIPGETLKGLTRDATDKLLAMPALEIYRCDGTHITQPRPTDTETELCGVSLNRRDQCCVLCRIFGSTFSPGNFQFSPAYYAETYDKLSTHPEIAKDLLPLQVAPTAFNKIDRWTGRAQEDHLFSLELGTKQRAFEFSVTEIDPRRFPEKRRRDVILLACSLRMVRKLGGKRRRGKGQCLLKIKVENIQTLGDDLTPENLIDRLKGVATE